MKLLYFSNLDFYKKYGGKFGDKHIWEAQFMNSQTPFEEKKSIKINTQKYLKINRNYKKFKFS